MTTRQTPEVLLARDDIVAPPQPRACDDQSFELPTGIYVAMGLMFAGAVVVLGSAFSGHMAVSLGVIFAFLAAFFAIPVLFPRMARDKRTSALSWTKFLDRGIATETGRASAGAATVLVLTLPALILFWAMAIAVIASLTM